MVEHTNIDNDGSTVAAGEQGWCDMADVRSRLSLVVFYPKLGEHCGVPYSRRLLRRDQLQRQLGPARMLGCLDSYAARLSVNKSSVI